MKRRTIKILGLVLLMLILSTAIFLMYKTDMGRQDVLSNKPRRPRYEVPITYNIDWWSSQNRMIIDSFKVKIVESNLNLFNSVSLISYKVTGRIKSENNWEYHINKVHLSERINRDSLQDYDRIIEITPVLEAKQGGKDSTYINFSFKNEQTIYSNRWGVNRIKFICSNHQQVIDLFQRK